jgi:hypothetical protein
MRREFVIGITICLLGLSQMFSSSTAAAQPSAPPNLEQQLQAQYQPTKLKFDSGNLTVANPGTVLDVQKDGIVAFTADKLAVCPSSFKDGHLKPPNAFCVGMLGGQDSTRAFKVGEKVYLTKMDVKVEKEKISFALVDCDTCNGVDPPTFYKSEVVFQFAKGYLEKANPSQVEDTIGQVLSIDEGDDQGQQQGPPEQQGQQEQPQDSQAQGDQNQAPAQPQAPPPRIALHQTVDQVVSVLGQPDKIVDLGAKQIYIYKDLKVTFLDGKVADVE